MMYVHDVFDTIVTDAFWCVVQTMGGYFELIAELTMNALHCLGTLSIRGSSIVSIGSFAHLLTIDTTGDAIVVNGKSYEVVITGLPI